ncbi:MAG TPA: AsmA-like C-terminal region-containing protein [Opitutaceae bacterium]
MKRALQFLGLGARHCLSVAGSFILWSVWLALALVLAAQVYILSSSQLEVPQFALRRIEERLAESGIVARCGRAIFDPLGRVLLENVKLSLPAYPDPVVTARSIYLTVDPWWLAAGRVEFDEVHVIDATVAVPAMLSPTGQPVEIVSRLHGSFSPTSKTLNLQQLSGNIAGVFVTANGSIVLPKKKDGPPFEKALAAFVRDRFAVVCRQALEVGARARQFERPELHLDFAPSESGAASASLLFLARAGELAQPFAARATGLRARTRVLLFGDTPPSWFEFSAATVDVPGRVRVAALQGEVYGRFQPGPYVFEPREITLTADSAEAAGFAVERISTQIQPRPLPKLDVSAVALVNRAPLGLEAETDLERKDARVSFAGEIDPRLLVILSERLKVNIRRFFDFERLNVDRGEATFEGGWKFQKLDAHLRLDGVNAYGVRMTDGRVIAKLTPERFYSPDASARVGENYARGTYEHDLRTQDYRFLLDGRLRPMVLEPWFKEWWTDFFKQLDFTTAPPLASVDVQSRWRPGSQSSVFVFADADRPVVRGAPLERLRTRLFIRPGFFDGLELFLTQGEGFGGGRFTVFLRPEEKRESIDLAMRSSLDLKTISSLLGPEAATVLDAFEVAQAPELAVRGRFTLARDSAGPHQELRVEARTAGPFRFRAFPMTDASFTATWRDDDISIDDFEALVAGGVALGHARIWGRGEERRLGFDISLNQATLGQAASTGADFIARRKGLPPEPPGKFVQEKADVRLFLTASAEGAYDNPFSYRGNGSASISGSAIAEIPLLGALSEVLKFTSLRFTEAQTSFKIEGPRVVFPDVKVRGPDGAIDGQGTYILEKRGLDFQAKISPFQESEGILKTVVGVVLTPITSAFEVKLTGTLDKPNWAVTLNPGNIIRSITPGETVKAAPASEPAPATPPPTPPPSKG